MVSLLVAGALSYDGVSGPARAVSLQEPPGGFPRDPALFRAAMLVGHTAARAEVGEGPLEWDDMLAADAARYADTLARTGVFRHAEQVMGPGREGENLFTGTRGAYSYAEMVDLWVAEKKDFVNLPTPDFSRTGKFGDVGHYTQIVWHSTTRVGCALSSNATDDYVVCRYSPPGNVMGERTF